MMPERRDFLLKTIKSLGLATAGGLVWSGFIEEGKAAPLILRPPGAAPEKAFLASCIKCGMCVEACPYDALALAEPGDNKPVGTPYFIPRSTPCRMCKDIPCVPACPTGSLDQALVSDKDENGEMKFNIDLAKMGLAVIDRETCIAYSGIQCDACYRACPLIDKAITVEYTRNVRTGKHAMLAPVVHSKACTGCGMCEKVCVTKKASIFVLPIEIAMGESSERYVKGWDERDEDRLKDISDKVTTETPRSGKSPVDYLNEEEF
ncbi:MAG: ferredoxin-type protein NapG [Thermodesulfovibrionia bacterium]|nr:ferredoxin-type protein NapG [Thermodesulfovibrionia bacterium]